MEKNLTFSHIEDKMNDLVFTKWTDENEQKLREFILLFNPSRAVRSVDIIIGELGDISNDFGEDCACWNSASMIASKAIRKLLKGLEDFHKLDAKVQKVSTK